MVLKGTLLPFPETGEPLPTPFAKVEAEGEEGHEQEERVDKRKKRKTAATKAERTRAGTVTTMPLDVVGDAWSAICDCDSVTVYGYAPCRFPSPVASRTAFPRWRCGSSCLFLREIERVVSIDGDTMNNIRMLPL